MASEEAMSGTRERARGWIEVWVGPARYPLAEDALCMLLDSERAAAFAEGVEAAAKVAEEYDGDGHDHDHYTQLGDSRRTQSDITAEIRQRWKDLLTPGEK